MFDLGDNLIVLLLSIKSKTVYEVRSLLDYLPGVIFRASDDLAVKLKADLLQFLILTTCQSSIFVRQSDRESGKESEKNQVE